MNRLGAKDEHVQVLFHLCLYHSHYSYIIILLMPYCPPKRISNQDLIE